MCSLFRSGAPVRGGDDGRRRLHRRSIVTHQPPARARDLFDAYLPLARYEQQLGPGWAQVEALPLQRGPALEEFVAAIACQGDGYLTAREATDEKGRDL